MPKSRTFPDRLLDMGIQRRRARLLPWLVIAAALVAGSPARAQFVNLSRCRAAAPCSFPFAVQYRPDPLLGGQYGFASQTGFAASVSPDSLVPRLNGPGGDVDQRAVESAVREYLRFHPKPEPTGR